MVHLPDADAPGAQAYDEAVADGDRAGGEPPGWASGERDWADLALIDPDALEDLIVAELSGSTLFGDRFREAAARALLSPRAYPGRRTPLWQQRLKSQTPLEVARRYDDFPIVLEAYRECPSARRA